MDVQHRLSKFSWHRLGPWQQDSIIALGTFVVGCLLYTIGLYPLFNAPDEPISWGRFALFAGLCATEICRRHFPGSVFAIGTIFVAVDIFLGLSAPVVAVYSDIIYVATLYGSRRLSRSMVPFVAIASLASIVIALLLADNWRVAILVAAAAIPLLIIPVWWGTSVRQYRELAEQEKENSRQLTKIAELDRKAAIAAERSHMARDLHDVIAGHLSAIAIQSEAALSINTTQAPLTMSALQSIRHNSVRALEEMRAMIVLLRDDETTTSETHAPARLAELSTLVRNAQNNGVTLEVRTVIDSLDLPTAVDLTAYRIAQEALTNIAKHAPGTHARLDIYPEGHTLVITVTNELPNTKTTAKSRKNGGLGLLTMKERADSIGGSFYAGVSQRQWLVRAVLPLTEPS